MEDFKKKFGFITSFLPWLFLGVISKFSFNLAVISAFLISLLSFNRIRKGFIIDCGTSLFLIVCLIMVLFFKNMWFAQGMFMFGIGFLALLAWGSILFRYPFTIDYAKLRVPKEMWNSYLFLHVNYIISMTFALSFSFMTGFQLIKIYFPNFLNPVLFPLIYWGILILNFAFISLFPQWYKKRYEAKISKK